MERMMRLSTGEEITEIEWQCRVAWNAAEVAYWWTDRRNLKRAAEITRNLIAAMQRDPQLD